MQSSDSLNPFYPVRHRSPAVGSRWIIWKKSISKEVIFGWSLWPEHVCVYTYTVHIYIYIIYPYIYIYMYSICMHTHVYIIYIYIFKYIYACVEYSIILDTSLEKKPWWCAQLRATAWLWTAVCWCCLSVELAAICVNDQRVTTRSLIY